MWCALTVARSSRTASSSRSTPTESIMEEGSSKAMVDNSESPCSSLSSSFNCTRGGRIRSDKDLFRNPLLILVESGR